MFFLSLIHNKKKRYEMLKRYLMKNLDVSFRFFFHYHWKICRHNNRYVFDKIWMRPFSLSSSYIEVTKRNFAIFVTEKEMLPIIILLIAVFEIFCIGCIENKISSGIDVTPLYLNSRSNIWFEFEYSRRGIGLSMIYQSW